MAEFRTPIDVDVSPSFLANLQHLAGLPDELAVHRYAIMLLCEIAALERQVVEVRQEERGQWVSDVAAARRARDDGDSRLGMLRTYADVIAKLADDPELGMFRVPLRRVLALIRTPPGVPIIDEPPGDPP